MKTEFIKKNLTGRTVCYSLYVNDKETNIFFFEPESTFGHSKEQVLAQKEMIDNGLVFPDNGDWKDFDFCRSIRFDLSEARQVDDEPYWKNHIYRCTGSDFSSQEIRNRVMAEIKKNKSHLTQWTKRISKSNELLNNVGVKFYDYGYIVFFTKI